MKKKRTFKAPGLIPALCSIIITLPLLFSCGKEQTQAFSFNYKEADISQYITVPEISSISKEELEGYASSIAAGSVLYDTGGEDKLILPGDRLFFGYTVTDGERSASGDASLVIGEETFCRGFDEAISYLTLTMGKERDVRFITGEDFSGFKAGEEITVSVTPTLVVPRRVYEAVTFYAAQDRGALMQETSQRSSAMFGDTVDISYEIYYEGTIVSSGRKSGLVVGSLTFGDAFEKAVIGLETGGSTETYCTAPDGFSPSEYAGKDVRAVIGLERITYRTFDDEMAKALGYASADEYMDRYDEDYLNANALWNALSARAAVKEYHSGIVDYYAEWYVSSFKELYGYYSSVYGQMFTVSYPTFEDFIIRFAEFASMDEFNDAAKEDAKRNAFDDLLTFALAQRYGIELTDEEIAIGAAKTAADYNYSSVDELIADGYTEYQLQADLLKEKVMTEIYAIYRA